VGRSGLLGDLHRRKGSCTANSRHYGRQRDHSPADSLACRCTDVIWHRHSSRCRHADGLPSIRRPRGDTPGWPARCNCAADRPWRPRCAQGRRYRPRHPPRHTPAIRTLRRAVGETPLEESECLVHFMLPINVAKRTQDAHRLVAGPRAPGVGARCRRCVARAPLRTART